MKKIIAAFLILITMILGSVKGATSESFEKVLSMMNVPTKNVNGYEINEEIYQKYALIVYGSPYDVVKNQRWKDVATGKWTNPQTGRKGEYRILGYSLSGTVVNNELFPDDATSGISPEEWNYITIEDALSSWNDTEKYQTKQQYEYMLTQRLSRNGTTYNLTATSIGLDKARLEAYATWKTAGSIFTLKRDAQGTLWGATFHVPAMAADAKLNARLDLPSGTRYQLEPEQEMLTIPLTFGAEVTGLTEYAKQEDIQTISSELEIQNNLYDKIKATQKTNIQKENELVIYRADYPNVNRISITMKNTAVLETCFHAEAPMVDIKEITIEIIFQEEEEEEFIQVKNTNKITQEDIPRPIISSINLYRKSLTSTSQKASLYVAKKTSTPFICAGQVLVVEATIKNSPDTVTFAIQGDSKIQTLDDLTKRFAYEEPKSRNEKMIFSTLNALKNSYALPRKMTNQNGVYLLEYIIPYGTKQSLHSWATLRNLSNSALEIDTNKLFTRITQPYVIKIKATNGGGTVTNSVNLDVFERWDTIYNRNITAYVK